MTTQVPAAALAGVPAGVQAQGVWMGRRQLFVRFAGEAETATMYTAVALHREIDRQLARSQFHSVAIGGRDPLGNIAFLLSAFSEAPLALPVMLDTDGQRPEALALLAPHLAMAQVTVEFSGSDAMMANAIKTLVAATAAGCPHALVLCPREDTTDGQLMRIVEGAHIASSTTRIIVHPPFPLGDSPMLDRRWAGLLEHAVGTHADTRLSLRLPPPTGLR